MNRYLVDVEIQCGKIYSVMVQINENMQGKLYKLQYRNTSKPFIINYKAEFDNCDKSTKVL